MTCFEPEKSIVHTLLKVIANDRITIMNERLNDITSAWNGKNLYGKVRLEIAACPDDGAFFLNTDEVVALGVVVMKITIHVLSAR